MGLFTLRINTLLALEPWGGGAATPSVKASKPRFGTINDDLNTVALSSDYAYTQVRWGVEGQAAQALASNSICSPGNIEGRLYAYVVADPSANPRRLQSDTVYSDAFSLAASANNAPTVSLAVLGGTSSVTPGQSVTLQATAQDADGRNDVVKIEYFDNGVKLAGGETSGPDGSLQTTGLSAGTHNFTAKATDSKNATGLSNAVVVTVQAAATSPITALAWVGDSRYFGSGASSVPGLVSAQFASSVLETTIVSTGGQGVGIVNSLGSPIPSMLDELPSKVYPFIDAAKAAGKRVGVILEGGINDVTLHILSGKTNQQCIDAIWASWQQYHSLVQARGAISLHSTMFAAQSQNPTLNDQQRADQETIRLALVTKLRNQYQTLGIQVLSDVASDYALNDVADTANRTVYDESAVHLLDDAKANIVVPIEKRAVQALLDHAQGVVISSLRTEPTGYTRVVINDVTYTATGSTYTASLNWSWNPAGAGDPVQFNVDDGSWVDPTDFAGLAAGSHKFGMRVKANPGPTTVYFTKQTGPVGYTRVGINGITYTKTGSTYSASLNWFWDPAGAGDPVQFNVDGGAWVGPQDFPNLAEGTHRFGIRVEANPTQTTVYYDQATPNAPVEPTPRIDYVAYVPTSGTYSAEIFWRYATGTGGVPDFRVDGGVWQSGDGRFYNLTPGDHTFQMRLGTSTAALSAPFTKNTSTADNRSLSEENATPQARFFSDGWQPNTSSSWSGGTGMYKYTGPNVGNDGSVYFDEAFTGSIVEIWMPTGPNQGDFAVLIGGVEKVVASAYSAEPSNFRLVAAVHDLPAGNKVLRVSKRGGDIIFSDLLVYPDGHSVVL